MLDDLSKHVLDIAENSVNARAETVEIVLAREGERFSLTVRDDGCGMDAATCAAVVDPFVTSRTTRRVGLGIPFLKQSAELCGGGLLLESEPGKGTTLRAEFCTDCVDFPPLGDLPATVMTLLAGYPNIRWIFRFSRGDAVFEVDRDELVRILEDSELLRTPAVATWLAAHVAEGLGEIGLGGEGSASDHES